MRTQFILCTLLSLCTSGTAQAMLARMFPRLVPAARTSCTQVRSYNEQELVQQIHKDQARTYLQTIKNPERDTRWDRALLNVFLSERAALTIVIDAVLNNISGSDLASQCSQRLVATELSLLDPKSTVERFRHSADRLVYAKAVEECLAQTVRIKLGCKAPRLNYFERTLGRTTFAIEEFEQQHNINFEEVTWEEQEDRSVALLKAYLNTYCNTGSADDRRHAVRGVYHVIDLMRLERSHDLSVAAGEILSEQQ